MVITFVPIDVDVKGRDRHWHRKDLDRFKTYERLGKSIRHNCEQVRICDNHRERVKSRHAYRIFSMNLMARQHLIDGMSHSSRVSDGMLRFQKRFQANSRSKSRMACAHDTHIAFWHDKRPQKSRG